VTVADHSDLVAQLESVADALTDRAIEVLRTAIEEGAVDKPAEEKELVRAQRAVDKAVRILRTLDGSLEPPPH
jgi:hypothetical protein